MLVLLAERADTRNYTGERLLFSRANEPKEFGLRCRFQVSTPPNTLRSFSPCNLGVKLTDNPMSINASSWLIRGLIGHHPPVNDRRPGRTSASRARARVDPEFISFPIFSSFHEKLHNN